MSTSTELNKDEKGKSVNIKAYRCMIGSLLYLTASRPDIMFSICLCARFQSCPKKSHLHAVKKSTSRTCQFFYSSLVSWFSKKQNSVALSITKTEYYYYYYIKKNLINEFGKFSYLFTFNLRLPLFLTQSNGQY